MMDSIVKTSTMSLDTNVVHMEQRLTRQYLSNTQGKGSN